MVSAAVALWWAAAPAFAGQDAPAHARPGAPEFAGPAFGLSVVLTLPSYADISTAECVVDRPEYYAIDLVPTNNLPGLGRAGGKGLVTYDESPFGISVTENGHYVYDLTVAAQHLPDREDGRYVAWVTTPDLSAIERIGPLDEHLEATANVAFNKFLVVVTFERLDAGAAQSGSSAAAAPVSSLNARSATSSWQGPIVLRGMSRSGLMHTMAGHGPFGSEPCAKYGY